jgi:hypothetical protein
MQSARPLNSLSAAAFPTSAPSRVLAQTQKVNRDFSLGEALYKNFKKQIQLQLQLSTNFFCTKFPINFFQKNMRRIIIFLNNGEKFCLISFFPIRSLKPKYTREWYRYYLPVRRNTVSVPRSINKSGKRIGMYHQILVSLNAIIQQKVSK